VAFGGNTCGIFLRQMLKDNKCQIAYRSSIHDFPSRKIQPLVNLLSTRIKNDPDENRELII